ncbi:hypothetical protein JQ604_00590 [Bradyrhizobium jicamae]|uniref:hypothetical protein n=1 Tax=Bradyrhizobium jicamae TaxID=280332 RepID=UPI001BA799E5|nr:hypothetical protein [Bradyrhizobium jicamae]MBR0750674.1 hypothetical protein [Bradyrhizobium jicamae]
MANAPPNCPRCGRKMIAVSPSEGNGPSIMLCRACDAPDPLQSEVVVGWIHSTLRPPD